MIDGINHGLGKESSVSTLIIFFYQQTEKGKQIQLSLLKINAHFVFGT